MDRLKRDFEKEKKDIIAEWDDRNRKLRSDMEKMKVAHETEVPISTTTATGTFRGINSSFPQPNDPQA